MPMGTSKYYRDSLSLVFLAVGSAEPVFAADASPPSTALDAIAFLRRALP